MSNLDLFQEFCRAEEWFVPEKEYRFHDKRKWRFDYAWPDYKIALEVEGGIWMNKGAHNTGKAILRDIEKYNTATIMGWRIIRTTPNKLLTIETLDMLNKIQI